MNSEGTSLYVTFRVLQFSLFVAVLSLIGGIGIGWVNNHFIFGATFGTACFYCVLMGFVPFQNSIFGPSLGLIRTRFLVFLEATLAVAIVYFCSMITLRSLDYAWYEWILSSRHQYITLPGCFYLVVILVLAANLIIQHLRTRA